MVLTIETTVRSDPVQCSDDTDGDDAADDDDDGGYVCGFVHYADDGHDDNAAHDDDDDRVFGSVYMMMIMMVAMTAVVKVIVMVHFKSVIGLTCADQGPAYPSKLKRQDRSPAPLYSCHAGPSLSRYTSASS